MRSKIGCYQHVQAIIVSIDMYAESALGIGVLSETTAWGWREPQRRDPLSPVEVFFEGIRSLRFVKSFIQSCSSYSWIQPGESAIL
jgi:hypothetical protein